MTTNHPARTTVEELANGGALVRLIVPTYEGEATFELMAERDNDGDWRVYLPWPHDKEGETGYVTDAADTEKVYEVSGGIACLGAPEQPEQPLGSLG